MSSYRKRPSNLHKLLEENRSLWDNDGVPADVRAAIDQSLLCGTGALGAEVYSSSTGESRVVDHTCKSRACTSCGYWQTIRWQQEVVSQLPDIPYCGVLLTMPEFFWRLLRNNRRLLPSLSVLGAGVLTDWGRERFQAEVPIVCVLHTFNPQLEFNVHLHIVVGCIGLHLNGNEIVRNIYFPANLVRERWRKALLDLLELGARKGTLHSELSVHELLEKIAYYRTLWWKVGAKSCTDKQAIFDYIARYMRRPPMADYRIRGFDANQVRFLYKDKRDGNKVHVTTLPIAEFVRRFVSQVPHRYLHGVRYFGLLAPRAKTTRYRAFLRLTGLPFPRRVRRLRWAESLRRTFGFDPLIDSRGNRMTWNHRMPPQPLASRAP